MTESSKERLLFSIDAVRGDESHRDRCTCNLCGGAPCSGGYRIKGTFWCCWSQCGRTETLCGECRQRFHEQFEAWLHEPGQNHTINVSQLRIRIKKE